MYNKELFKIFKSSKLSIIASRPCCGAEDLTEALKNDGCVAPIITTGLSRAIDARPGHHPVSDDLLLDKEILALADTIVIVSRLWYYDEKANPNEYSAFSLLERGQALGREYRL